MSKIGKTQEQTLTTGDYQVLLNAIKDLIEMFQQVAEPKIFWWSITVSEDITVSGGISVTLYRWAEVLKDEYREELCNLGGIGNKDRNKWILYAVTGEGVTLGDYKKVADVCASAVKALWIPEHQKCKLSIFEYFNGFVQYVVSGEGIASEKETTSEEIKKLMQMREAKVKAFWVSEHPEFKLSVSRYFDGFIRGKDYFSSTGISASQKGYWVLNWFEFIYNTVLEDYSSLRAECGYRHIRDWDIATVPYRKIDHGICEASIMALKFLRTKVEARIKSAPQGQARIDPTVEKQDRDGQGGDETTKQVGPAKEPSKEAAQAYKLYFSSGMKQEDVAKKMTDRLRTPVSQGQVSRWVNEYRTWRKAERIPVDDKKPDIITNTDILDMGARTDSRLTGDPRHKRDADYGDND